MPTDPAVEDRLGEASIQLGKALNHTELMRVLISFGAFVAKRQREVIADRLVVEKGSDLSALLRMVVLLGPLVIGEDE